MSGNSSSKFAFSELSIPNQRQRIQEEYVALHHVDMEHGLRKDEFKTAKANRGRNRYCDVLANEPTMYPAPCGAACSDDEANNKDDIATGMYINANAIDFSALGVEIPHRFVSSQAPPTEYIGEWWTVVAARQIALVMMVTQEVENGVNKADRYWPNRVDETLTFKGGSVTLLSEKEIKEEHIVVRKMSVVIDALKEQNIPAHEVQQVHYKGWPDHGVPNQPEAFHHLVRYISEFSTEHPVLVHCSAGIGRTGTLISVYVALALAQQNALRDDSIFNIVKLLKRSRTGSVQRIEQYLFIYRSVEAFLKRNNNNNSNNSNK